MDSAATNEDFDPPPDLRLDWIEAFISAAVRRKFTDAPIKERRDPDASSKGVINLEMWLRLPLYFPNTSPIELTEFGEALLPDALSGLSRLSNDSPLRAGVLLQDGSLVLDARVSKLWLHHLRQFLLLVEFKSFKVVASESSTSVSTVTRNMKALAGASTSPLFRGYSQQYITDEGLRLAAAIEQLISMLEAHRARLPRGFDGIALKRIRTISACKQIERYLLRAISVRKIAVDKASVAEQLAFLVRYYQEIREMRLRLEAENAAMSVDDDVA